MNVMNVQYLGMMVTVTELMAMWEYMKGKANDGMGVDSALALAKEASDIQKDGASAIDGYAGDAFSYIATLNRFSIQSAETALKGFTKKFFADGAGGKEAMEKRIIEDATNRAGAVAQWRIMTATRTNSPEYNDPAIPNNPAFMPYIKYYGNLFMGIEDLIIVNMFKDWSMQEGHYNKPSMSKAELTEIFEQFIAVYKKYNDEVRRYIHMTEGDTGYLFGVMNFVQMGIHQLFKKEFLTKQPEDDITLYSAIKEYMPNATAYFVRQANFISSCHFNKTIMR